MRILLIEPYYTGSHKKWVEGVMTHSTHEIEVLTLPGRHWKWRMHGAAVTLSQQYLALPQFPDLILATEMLDVSTFLALIRHTPKVPLALYFHENQLTYPWSEYDPDLSKQRNLHYAFINYTSALAADAVLFNSHFHQKSFLSNLEPFLRQYPDFKNLATVKAIEEKSAVLWLGLDLSSLDQYKIEQTNQVPIILWNHRWEYDKNPDLFFSSLYKLDCPFQLVVLGANYRGQPPVFDEALRKLGDKILHWGYTERFEEYAGWLWKADIALTTSHQDFFGGSVVEAIYTKSFPILPERLAYPEHTPSDYQSDIFYKNEVELPHLLRRAIQEQIDPNVTLTLRNYVKRYDWQHMIQEYDAFFSQMAW